MALQGGLNLFDEGLSEEDAIAEVREYARLTGEVHRIDGTITRAVALGETVSDLENERAEMDRQRLDIQSRVEELIEGQVSGILAQEGMSWRIGFLDADGYLFPPVDFKYENSPPVLVISPRDRIELESTRLLTPGLGLEDREDIENEVEELESHYSALVVDTGGWQPSPPSSAHLPTCNTPCAPSPTSGSITTSSSIPWVVTTGRPARW